MASNTTTPRKPVRTYQPTILEPVYDRITSLYEAANPELTGEWYTEDILKQLEDEGYDLQAIGRFLLEQFVESAGGDRVSFYTVEFLAQLRTRA